MYLKKHAYIHEDTPLYVELNALPNEQAVFLLLWLCAGRCSAPERGWLGRAGCGRSRVTEVRTDSGPSACGSAGLESRLAFPDSIVHLSCLVTVGIPHPSPAGISGSAVVDRA